MSGFHVPGTVVGAGDRAVNQQINPPPTYLPTYQTNKTQYSWNLHSMWGGDEQKNQEREEQMSGEVSVQFKKGMPH